MKNSEIDRIKESLEEMDDWRRQKEIDDGIRKGLTKWAHTICMSATSAALGASYALGRFISDQWEPLNAGIRAYFKARNGL